MGAFQTTGHTTMTQHTIKDLSTRNVFHIVDFDEASGLIRVHFRKDGWIQNFDEFQTMTWIDFVSGIMQGRFEISTKTSSHC